ncbi:MAG: fimbrillin family protein, partial [Bacteroidaceae bacterium]|nr:fimbrillin family protein [Bacteroidaceae bacterium]
MNTIKVFLLSLAAAGIAACSADDDDPVTGGQQQPLPLTITVDENPLLNPDASSQAPATRAAITTTTSLTAFTLDYQYIRAGELQYGNNSVTKDASGNWSAGYWPTEAGESTEVGWYAHTDGTIVNQTGPYIRFSVEELATSQKDLLVASASGSYSSTGGKLSLTFDHACTALRFYVKKAKNLDDYMLTVTSIKLCNVVKDGKYYFATSSWTPGNTRTLFTLYEGSGMTLGSTDYTLLNS